MKRNLTILAALLMPLTMLGAACGGGDSGDETSSGTEATDVVEDTTTTEAAAPDVNGEWALTLTLTESTPPDVIPADDRTRERTLTLALGDCPTETTFEGPEAGNLASVTPQTDPATCVGSARWEQGADNFLIDVPLLLDGDTYTVAAALVTSCVDSETGEVVSPTGGTSDRALTFTVSEGADGEITGLQGEVTAENALDPAVCPDPVETFATATSFSVEGVPA